PATETLGLVCLEAMASGLPVIAVAAGGVREYLRDDVNGVACPEGDIECLAAAMLRVAHDPGLHTRLVDGAMATTSALSWDSELDRLESFYAEAIANGVRHGDVAYGS
ncbi:MAG: glycosyltransferase, partial [Gemmatimonadaceae bacterium]|nr:glycosyltransferase [Gemmatimonadaceae bacterium]